LAKSKRNRKCAWIKIRMLYGNFTRRSDFGLRRILQREKDRRRQKKKDADEEGKTMADMYLLVPDKNDETLSKWRWLNVKQIGAKPCPRSGIACSPVPGTNRVLFFGGVQDNELDIADDDSDDDDGKMGNFFNDIFSVNVENERATWTKLELTGKKEAGPKKSRRKDKADQNDDMEDDVDEKDEKIEESEKGVTKVVEEGAFTITSTVGLESEDKNKDDNGALNLESKFSQMNLLKGPSPRFGAHLAFRQGTLYLFGGVVEDANDRQLTHKDLYALDIHKLDEWEVIIESDIKTMEWVDSESSGEDSEDDDDDDSDSEGEGMDTSQ